MDPTRVQRTDRPDAALVRRAQRGDHGAFTIIVRGSIDRLYSVANLIAHDRVIAEDAVQDALLRAWRDLPALRDPERFTPWLSRLAVHATYDLLRQRKRVTELRPEPGSAKGIEAGAVDRLVVSWAYDRLPVEQRAVIVLHYYVGLTLDEVADALSIPAGTVRSRLNAALVSMRRSIGTDASTAAATTQEVLR